MAREGAYLVFIEAKYRRGAVCGDPSEAVDHRKQQTISRVALFYLLCHGYAEHTPVRFDVVAVSRKWCCTGMRLNFADAAT